MASRSLRAGRSEGIPPGCSRPLCAMEQGARGALTPLEDTSAWEAGRRSSVGLTGPAISPDPRPIGKENQEHEPNGKPGDGGGSRGSRPAHSEGLPTGQPGGRVEDPGSGAGDAGTDRRDPAAACRGMSAAPRAAGPARIAGRVLQGRPPTGYRGRLSPPARRCAPSGSRAGRRARPAYARPRGRPRVPGDAAARRRGGVIFSTRPCRRISIPSGAGSRRASTFSASMMPSAS